MRRTFRGALRRVAPLAMMTRFLLNLMTLWLAVAATAACNAERKQECDKFADALRVLDNSSPSSDALGHARDSLAATTFQDEPLREYAKNTKMTLTVLVNTLALRDDTSAPDGTNDVIKQKFKEVRTDRDDVARYCSQ